MSEREAEMNENGENEIELSIVLSMFTTLFCLKVVAKTIREIVDRTTLVEDSGLAPTMEADKQPRLEPLGEALADRIAEPLEPYWGHQTLSRTTTMTIFELKSVRILTLRMAKPEINRDIQRYFWGMSKWCGMVCVLEAPTTLQTKARSSMLATLSIFAVQSTTPYILKVKSWLAAVFKE